jgi:hypothetical protein
VNTTRPTPLAVIEGALCRLTRQGSKSVGHRPLATAVVEFQQTPFRCYVREHTYGLLPGFPNLYALDGAFRLQWMAEWPDLNDPCAKIVREKDGVLETLSQNGLTVRLDAFTGRLISARNTLAAAG